MNRITIIAAGALALFAVSAHAVDHTVTALSSRVFDPSTLTINVGDTVTFVNGGGFHNVESAPGAVTTFRCANGCDGDGMGGSGEPSSDPWTATVAFPTAGSVPFQCEIHVGQGMTGTITVVDGGGGAPVIGVDPLTIAASVEEGLSTTVPLAISNSGDADLTWTADTASVDCATPDLVPWLSLAPTGGTVAVGDPAANVDVTLDATLLTAGVYNANVCVHSNDTGNDLVAVPVVFTVDIPDLVFFDGFDGLRVTAADD